MRTLKNYYPLILPKTSNSLFDKKINIDTDTEKYCNILVRYWYWLSIFLHSASISILQYISDTDTRYFFSVSAKSLQRDAWKNQKLVKDASNLASFYGSHIDVIVCVKQIDLGSARTLKKY